MKITITMRMTMIMSTMVGLMLLQIAQTRPTSLSLAASTCPPNPINWNLTQATKTPFILSDCSGPADQQTSVHVCYDSNYLRLHFETFDDNMFNPYQNCNDPLFKYGRLPFPSPLSYSLIVSKMSLRSLSLPLLDSPFIPTLNSSSLQTLFSMQPMSQTLI